MRSVRYGLPVRCHLIAITEGEWKLMSVQQILAINGLQVPKSPLPEPSRNFSEIKLGFTEDMAVADAVRCSRCDVREP